jgi:predicted metal-dependent HD superfamily phosphohydrolase
MKSLLTPDIRKELLTRYAESHRHYHTIDHIISTFQLASSLGVRLSAPQIMALWYHDAVYDPASKTNEEDSCQLLIKHQEIESTLSNVHFGRALGIIMDTKWHISDDNESQIVIDLDLAGFGNDVKSYDHTTELLRKEYIHLTDNEWITGRKLFLQGILNRSYIFNTAWGKDMFEDKARSNITRELSKL